MLEAAGLSLFLGGLGGFFLTLFSLWFVRWPYSVPVLIFLVLFWAGIVEIIL